MKRVVAAVGVFVAACFLTATIALIALAQVVPAIVTLIFAVTIGSFSFTTYNSPDESELAPTGPIAPARELVPPEGGEIQHPSRTAALVRTLSWVLATAFAYAGLLQLVSAQFVVRRYQLWHYPRQLMWAVGAVDLVGAIALAMPWMAKYGAVVLMPVVLGAIYTFLFRGNPYLALVPAALLGLLGFVFWEHTETHLRTRLGRPGTRLRA